MYCEECGTENKKNAAFCENCGHKMSAKQKQVSKNETNKKVSNETKKEPMNKKSKIIIVIISCIMVILIAMYVVLSGKVKPQNVVDDYFKALINYDADKMYGYLEPKKSDFTTKKMFEKVVKNSEDKTENKIINYKIVNSKVDAMTAEIKINYVIENVEKSKDITIYLTKSKNKKWLLFDNWEITKKQFSDVEEYKLKVFKGSKVKVEGINVDKKYIDKDLSTNSMDVYKMPAMFVGYYNIEVTTPMGIEVKDIINVSSYGSYNCTINTKNLTSKFKKNLTNVTKESLQTIYDSAKENKTFDEIKDKFNYKKANLNNLKEDYENLLNGLSTSTSKLKSIKFNNVEIKNVRIDSSKGYLTLYSKVTYDYNVDYQSGEEIKQHSDDSYSYVYLYFDYVDNNLKLVDISRLNSYFSRY